MNSEIILVAIGCFLMGICAALLLIGAKDSESSIADQKDYILHAVILARESIIVDPGEFENITLDYPNIHWLSTRTHFNNNGFVVVGYEPLLAAVKEIDSVIGEITPNK